MLLFMLFLLRLKNEVDRFCEALDKTSLQGMLKDKKMTLDDYRTFLIQLHYYIVPGPALLAEDVKRIEKEGDADFKRYLDAHFEIEDTLIPLILTDLKDLGVSGEDIKRIGPFKETTLLNNHLEKLHRDPDPVFILVSDIAAKVLLDYYTPQIVEAVKPKLPDPSKGMGFLTKDTKAQIDIKGALLKVMRRRINFRNKKRFIAELKVIFRMFQEWTDAIASARIAR